MLLQLVLGSEGGGALGASEGSASADETRRRRHGTRSRRRQRSALRRRRQVRVCRLHVLLQRLERLTSLLTLRAFNVVFGGVEVVTLLADAVRQGGNCNRKGHFQKDNSDGGRR